MCTDGLAPCATAWQTGAAGTTAGWVMARAESSRGRPGQPHQRHREPLGLRQERAGKTPGDAQGGPLPPSEGMRAQVQHAGAGHVQVHASRTPQEAPKLGKPQSDNLSNLSRSKPEKSRGLSFYELVIALTVFIFTTGCRRPRDHRRRTRCHPRPYRPWGWQASRRTRQSPRALQACQACCPRQRCCPPPQRPEGGSPCCRAQSR